MIATLRIQVLFHWKSGQARQLATRLYRTFSARPMGDGPRIPVRYGPRQADGGPPPTIDLDAEREIIVILVDERMARRARASDQAIADKWGHLVSDLLGKHPPASASPHRVLPVALDATALQLAPALNDVSFVRLDVRQGNEKTGTLSCTSRFAPCVRCKTSRRQPGSLSTSCPIFRSACSSATPRRTCRQIRRR